MSDNSFLKLYFIGSIRDSVWRQEQMLKQQLQRQKYQQHLKNLLFQTSAAIDLIAGAPTPALKVYLFQEYFHLIKAILAICKTELEEFDDVFSQIRTLLGTK